MLSIRAIAFSLAVAVTLSGCAPRRSPQASSAPRSGSASVLLVSLDGFRADYLERGLTPNISTMVREGVRAEWMTPTYPSLTFPNHYTIVTGLHADHHGIVHNTMRDAKLGAFSLSNREAVANGAWWGGEPVWVTAERAGLPTATLFWPGSEAEIRGVRPSRTTVYDGKVPLNERIETVLGWLSEGAATRPRFVTLYIEALDDAGHGYGPDSVELGAALRVVDAAMGRLFDGLAARSGPGGVNVIITSDHGLAPVASGNTVAIEDMVDSRDAAVVTTGQSVGFVPQPGREREAYARLVGVHDHYECWRKEDLPPRWHYGTHPRVPPIVCQMQEGWDAATRAALAKRPPGGTRGSHGFDPGLPSMRTIFIARGPSFRRGVVVPPITSVDVYPLLMSLLGLAPAPNDGDPRALAGALSASAPARAR